MGQKRIILRPLRLNDVSDIYELMHMPNVLMGSSLLPSETLDEWRVIIEGWTHERSTHVFVADIDEKVVGTIKLKVGHGRGQHVGDIALAVHDKFQGQGIGKMLMLTVIDLADNWLNLVRLELDVYTDNERAIRLYQQFDFEIEGRKRQVAFRGGNYHDSYFMARLRPQMPKGYMNTLTQASEIPASPATSETEPEPES